MHIKISIALVTRNRPDSLERWFRSMAAQTVKPYEVIVSDDSGDDYSSVIKDLTEKYGWKYIPGPKKGLYANRNHAFINSSGTHILSADDDHTHPVDFIENIIKDIHSDPSRVWIYSERNPARPDTPLICPAEINWNGMAGTMPADPQNCKAISCGGSVYPREIFDNGLRYYEGFIFGHLWYLWGVELYSKGQKISFSDHTFFFHHWEDTVEYSRGKDIAFIKMLKRSSFFVAISYNLFFKKSFKVFLYHQYLLLKSIMVKTLYSDYSVKVRLSLKDVVEIYKHVSKYGKLRALSFKPRASSHEL
jgi:glycosyltransferase involved in cell wall biosynthesis